MSSIRLGYPDLDDPRLPIMLIHVRDRSNLYQLLASCLEKQRYYVTVETEPTVILTVTARTTHMSRLEMTAHLIDVVKAWHDMSCGIAQVYKKILIMCDHPYFKAEHYGPPENSQMIRAGKMISEQAVLYLTGDCVAALELQDKIDNLIATV